MRKALVAFAVLAVPRAALACPVCFGQSDSPLALGANMGIWVMLGFTGAVLSAFASFFVYLMRRAKLAAAMSGPAGFGSTVAKEAGHHVQHGVRHDGREDGPRDGQEGIAEC